MAPGPSGGTDDSVDIFRVSSSGNNGYAALRKELNSLEPSKNIAAVNHEPAQKADTTNSDRWILPISIT